MEGIYIPEGYKSPRTIRETEIQIKEVKDFFEVALAKALNLTRVSAPLFVKKNIGINDDLSGKEKPVSFSVPCLNKEVEVVQSLAKWKRVALKKYNFHTYKGLWTDMNAIRKDEKIDNFHSIYVDQWDWEKIIENKDRNIDYFILKNLLSLKNLNN